MNFQYFMVNLGSIGKFYNQQPFRTDPKRVKSFLQVNGLRLIIPGLLLPGILVGVAFAQAPDAIRPLGELIRSQSLPGKGNDLLRLLLGAPFCVAWVILLISTLRTQRRIRRHLNPFPERCS